jgi:hypothetical protein
MLFGFAGDSRPEMLGGSHCRELRELRRCHSADGLVARVVEFSPRRDRARDVGSMHME